MSLDFSAKDHGFWFRNDFELSLGFDLPLVGRITLGGIPYGLCGGMCFAALDYYFDAAKSRSTQTSKPGVGTDLYRYLCNRQLDSLSLPRIQLDVLPLPLIRFRSFLRAKVIRKVIRWMRLEDGDVGRLTARTEFPKLQKRLNNEKPAVLALIRTRWPEEKPTQNHQVVATGYDFDEATRQLTVYLYDPNHPYDPHHPWQEPPTLTMNFSTPSRGIGAAQSTRKPLRGFFVIDYKPQTPP